MPFGENHAISGILKLHISVHINENKHVRTNVLKDVDKQVFLCYNIISRKQKERLIL